VTPIRVGKFGELGWTSWMAPNWASLETTRRDARFHPAERMRHKRRQPKETGGEGGSNGRYQP
jgi:type VI secretion system protein ImpH